MRLLLPVCVFVSLAAVVSAPVPAGATEAEVCAAGSSTDFNGDGFVDVAVADASATVAGTANAGWVHVLYGGTAGTVTKSSLVSGVAGRFGTSLAVADLDGNGCDDLLVGAPAEPVNGVTGAGVAYLFYGSTAGLGHPPLTITQGQSVAGSAPETNDHFGATLAAGTTSGGLGFAVVGAPGESVGSLAGAGSVFYLRSNTWTEVTEDSPGVEGYAESGDRWGSALAATSLHFAVGNPLEDIAEFVDAGNVDVFSHAFASGVPSSVGFVNQEMAGQSGYAEHGDHFGAALSMSVFQDIDGKTKSLLAIGVPGEGLDVNEDAGRVVAMVTVAEAVDTSEYVEIHQGASDVAGAPEAGDGFGTALAIVNRAAPGVIPLWSELLLAVGVPGEEGALAEQGGVQVFSLVGGPGAYDRWVDPAIQAGSGWSPRASARLGVYLSASGSHLFIGDPAGNTPGLWAIPWTVVTGESQTDPVYAIRPGLNGVPIEGTGVFGTAAV